MVDRCVEFARPAPDRAAGCLRRPDHRLAEGNLSMTGSASEGGSQPGIDTGVIAALTELGFSQYEAGRTRASSAASR
jgi:hypothetical protein